MNQVLVSPRIVFSNFFRSMGDIELDRSTAARPEVYEKRPSARTEQVARMRLTVQQLLAGTPTAYRRTQATECVAEEFPVGSWKRWSPLSVANLSLSTCDSIGKMRCLEIDLAQPSMEPQECVRIVRRSDRRRSHRLVVCPERDSARITQIHAGFDPRLKPTHGTIGVGEPVSNLNFELGVGLMCRRCDPGKNIAGDEAHRDAVRVVNDDRIVDIQRIADIKRATGAFLTLHGGSGTDDEDFRRAIKAGITIIHINTELRVAFRRGLEAALAAHPDEVVPYKLFSEASQAMAEVVRHRLQLFNNP